MSDLKNRTKLANETAGGLLISIHQNCLPGYPNVRGAQVFYNAVLPSQQLAEAVQQTLNTAVNTDRAKAAKPIGDGVYLMTHTTCRHFWWSAASCPAAGDGASAAAVLPNENGRRHRGGLLPILYE